MQGTRILWIAAASLGAAVCLVRATRGDCDTTVYQFSKCNSNAVPCVVGADCYASNGSCVDGTAYTHITRTGQPIKFCVSAGYLSQTCSQTDRPCSTVNHWQASTSVCTVLACSITVISCGCG